VTRVIGTTTGVWVALGAGAEIAAVAAGAGVGGTFSVAAAPIPGAAAAGCSAAGGELRKSEGLLPSTVIVSNTTAATVRIAASTMVAPARDPCVARAGASDGATEAPFGIPCWAITFPGGVNGEGG
jgi:hypothetical protein